MKLRKLSCLGIHFFEFLEITTEGFKKMISYMWIGIENYFPRYDVELLRNNNDIHEIMIHFYE